MDETPESEHVEGGGGQHLIRLEIDAGDAEMAFTNGEPEMEFFIDLQTGKIELMVDPGIAGDEDEYEELKGRIEEMPDRYLRIDSTPSHTSYEFMEDFTEDEVDGRAQDDLRERLERRKPFRQFNDGVCDYPGLRERWFKYRDDRVKAYASQWLADNGVEAVFVPYGTQEG